MKFIIEPINETDCRIIDIDCSDEIGKVINELTFPPVVEHEGKSYEVKEVCRRACWTNIYDENVSKYATLKNLNKIIFSEGIEKIEEVMSPIDDYNSEDRGNSEYLKEVSLPSTLKVIGNFSFKECRQLTFLNIPKGLEEINKEAFFNCKSLELFQWPKSLKKVDLSSFYNMKNPLDERGDSTFILEIPDSLEIIEGYWNSGEIKECIVSDKKWEIIDSSKLPNSIRSINVPEGVTKILGHYHKIKHITLPASLVEIGDEVFKDSKILNSLDYLPESLIIIGEEAFFRSYTGEEIKEIKIPSRLRELGKNAFNCFQSDKVGRIKLNGDETTMQLLMSQPGAMNGTIVETIEIQNGATEVNISHCPELTNLILPSSVKIIETISYCPKLKSIILPDSVTHIREIGFNKNLTELKFPENLEQLEGIKYCPSLKVLNLPDSLKKLKEDPDDLQSVFKKIHAEIKASPKIWRLICSNRCALEGYNPEEENLKLPEGVDLIAQDLFCESKIKSIQLPSTLKKIGERAFCSCENLESIIFSEKSQLQEIGNEAFNKTAIRQLTLPDSLITLGERVFMDMENLENIFFPASILNYGNQRNFKDITDPICVRCKNLKYVVFLSDNKERAKYPVLLGKLCDWYVPDNMVSFVKEFTTKAKADFPYLKGIGAKNIKPISKLNGFSYDASPDRSRISTNKQNLTQAIKIQTHRLKIVYRFPVEESDLSMLNNKVDMTLLGIHYLKNKAASCSFDFESFYNPHTPIDLVVLSPVRNAPENVWHNSPKTIVKIDFSDKNSLPEDFPVNHIDNMKTFHSFSKYLESKIPNYRGKLPEGSPAYLEVKIKFNIIFDFMIGEKEKFNVKKITVLEDWKNGKAFDEENYNFRFAFLYNNRYIPATSFESPSYDLDIVAYNTLNFLNQEKSKDSEIKVSDNIIDGAKLQPSEYLIKYLPFLDNILSLIKN